MPPTGEGRPISVEVFKGNTADPATVAAQVTNLKERFGIQNIAWAGLLVISCGIQQAQWRLPIASGGWAGRSFIGARRCLPGAGRTETETERRR